MVSAMEGRTIIMIFRSASLAGWWAWLFLAIGPSVLASEIELSPKAVAVRLERTPVPSGAEIITLLCTQAHSGSRDQPNREIPILSVLRDTLNDSDPENDRLRHVWIYSHTGPSIWQRFVAVLPFAYRQATAGRESNGRLPRPVVDLAAPSRNTLRKLAEELFQAGVLNDAGISWRMASRSYRNNIKDHRDLQIYQALSALSSLETSPLRGELLTQEDIEVLGARLTLATRLLGGLVTERYLQSAWEKETFRSNENRGNNWELLRQKAEQNSLYFEPLALDSRQPDLALLWMEQPSDDTDAPKHFDGKFLGISDPFVDQRVREWTGYSQTWYFDQAGCRVTDGTAYARSANMIPLALYALDHPRVPLLLIDLRRPRRVGLIERSRRVATDITEGLLRWTPFSNLRFTIAKSVLFFVRGRHGAALDRSARLRAYAQLQYFLKLDESMDPELRSELTHFSQHLGINPLSHHPEAQVGLAQQQYESLVEYAKSPEGLERRLERDRAGELLAYSHSPASRLLFRLASTGTFGLYRHREKTNGDGHLELAQYRRFAYHRRFLGQVTQSGLKSDVAWIMGDVRRSLETVLELGESDGRVRPQVREFLSRLHKKAGEDAIRQECAEVLLKLKGGRRSKEMASSATPPAGTQSASVGISGILAFKQ